jgi:hypothetical protein
LAARVPAVLVDPVVGSALARWYSHLHRAGEPIARAGARPPGVRDWYEELDSAALLTTGQLLSLNDLPRSLLYNDFHPNLAGRAKRSPAPMDSARAIAELALDAPLALLAALARLDVAATVPRWATTLCEEVAGGRLDRMLADALG